MQYSKKPWSCAQTFLKRGQLDNYLPYSLMLPNNSDFAEWVFRCEPQNVPLKKTQRMFEL